MLKNINLLKTYLSIVVFCTLNLAFAEETTMEKAETGVNQAADSVKDTYREAKEKGCEMVNGKMECAAKKLKHKGQKLKDKVDTKATDIKNKVD